jgi:hypothetical protein
MPISMMTLKNIKNGVSNQRLNQFIVVLIMRGSAAYFKGVGFNRMNMQHLPASGSAGAKYPIQALTTDSA